MSFSESPVLSRLYLYEKLSFLIPTTSGRQVILKKRYNTVSTSGETKLPEMTISSAVFTITVISSSGASFS